MDLTFDKTEFQALIELTEKASAHSVPYTGEGWGCPKETTPGLILAGDEGVYLMSNADDQAKVPGKDSYRVAYAAECNPEMLDAETVWENKRMIFGGDDGGDFIELDTARKILAQAEGDFVCIGMTPTKMIFYIDATK